MRPLLVTAPLYYSDIPDWEQSRTLVAADAFARHSRAHGHPAKLVAGLGGKNKTSDEAEYNSRQARRMLGIWCETAPVPQRERRARAVFKKLLRNGAVYKARFDGYYCPECGFCFDEKHAADGKCPAHQIGLGTVNSEVWFFRLSAYTAETAGHYRRATDFLSPHDAARNALRLCEHEHQDIPVVLPGHDGESQRVCFWFETLCAYLSARQKGSPEDIQFADSKGLFLHAVVWPALLAALELPLPEHLHIMPGNRTRLFSPVETAVAYGTDALRYLLLRGADEGVSHARTQHELRRVYNAELANDIGSLLGRITLLVDKYLDGELPTKNPGDAYVMVNNARKTAEEINRHMSALEFDRALALPRGTLSALNKALDSKKSQLLDADGDRADLKLLLFELVWCLRMAAGWLEPFMPDTSAAIHAQLSVRKGIVSHIPPQPPLLFPRK
jgi:methionyl-tRNA synthetase